MHAIWGLPQGEDAKFEPLVKVTGYCVSGPPLEHGI